MRQISAIEDHNSDLSQGLFYFQLLSFFFPPVFNFYRSYVHAVHLANLSASFMDQRVTRVNELYVVFRTQEKSNQT